MNGHNQTIQQGQHMKDINLQITVEEANLLMEALGNLPFVKVYALIGKLQEQAGQQLNTNGKQSEEEKSEDPAPAIVE